MAPEKFGKKIEESAWFYVSVRKVMGFTPPGLVASVRRMVAEEGGALTPEDVARLYFTPRYLDSVIRGSSTFRYPPRRIIF